MTNGPIAGGLLRRVDIDAAAAAAAAAATAAAATVAGGYEKLFKEVYFWSISISDQQSYCFGIGIF